MVQWRTPYYEIAEPLTRIADSLEKLVEIKQNEQKNE